MNINELKILKNTVSMAMKTLAGTETRQDTLISILSNVNDPTTKMFFERDISKIKHIHELQLSMNNEILSLLNTVSEHDLTNPDFEELFSEIVADMNFLTVRSTVLICQLSEFERSMN